MNVLVVKDDKPGHYNQTEGILLSLKEIYPHMTVEYIDVEIKSKISRKLLRVLLNHFVAFFEKDSSLKYIKYFYKKFNLPQNKPNLIISTGGNTANLNAWFAKVYNAKNILNGKLRGLGEELFTKITTVIDLGYKNQIIIDAAPNTITSERLETESKNFLETHNLNGEFYSLLLGGDGAGYLYDDHFYDELIGFVINTSENNKIKWLISTSRRTPLSIEKKLKKSLENYYAYFVAYNIKPEKVLLPFLGASKAVFVTEESSSMISEAISAQKPVYTLRPKEAKPDSNYQNILQKFLIKKRIKRIDIFGLEDFEVQLEDFETIEDDTYIKISKKIKAHLAEEAL
ncbi:ELM1/GtrOC1 family putative glycosyltransferase [Sulfurovum sp.]|uniref:ELM1/GtrOC1 family putative glycosyltransferase n=1 Tax=Sulfurovum sp. TaxID=1969726 RepID=UPI002867D6CB|nr:ELM1/GtrOC1 family putative glycosyltransferase [Sulfurovum sp.]